MGVRVRMTVRGDEGGGDGKMGEGKGPRKKKNRKDRGRYERDARVSAEIVSEQPT